MERTDSEPAEAGALVEMFEEISRIPRCSKKEENIRRWLREWGDSRGFETEQDGVGNLLIRVPGSSGAEDAEPVILQGHMDMVCEKHPGTAHDFGRDPIPMEREGGWLLSRETTLGADDGVALAAALAAAEDPGLAHPPLELLFTVDEETGLTGALGLASEWLKGRRFINIDSEDEGIFTIGCAGGVECHLHLPVARRRAPEGLQAYRLTLGGLRGGHSGTEIHERRANANRLLARVLQDVRRRFQVEVASLSGGSAHNAIPRDAEAVILTSPGNLSVLEETAAEFQADFEREFAGVEQGISVTVGPASPETMALDRPAVEKALGLLLTLPHGVDGYSRDVEGLVETSANLASVRTRGDSLFFQTSQRSALESRLEEITRRIEDAARLAGASSERVNAYPAWIPAIDSPLLETARRVYRQTPGGEPEIEIIHAGLECGVIGAKYPGMDMLSIGPTIEGPHAPGERLNLPSLDRLWSFLKALLEELSRC